MTTHGQKRKNGATKEYTAWNNIRARCRNPKNKAFKYYGGRGIEVKFTSFEEFYDHIGPAPYGASIDRIDNDGHYEAGNVRWATKQQQMCNRSDNKTLTYLGRTMTLVEWSLETGLSVATLWARINNSGWSIEKALSTPLLSMRDASRLGHKARWK